MPKLLSYIFLLFFTIIQAHAQTPSVTVSGRVVDQTTKVPLPYIIVILKTPGDSAFVTGTVSGDAGRFTISSVKPGDYFLEFSLIGYALKRQPLYVGSLTSFLDAGTIELAEDAQLLNEVVVTGQQILTLGLIVWGGYSLS